MLCFLSITLINILTPFGKNMLERLCTRVFVRHLEVISYVLTYNLQGKWNYLLCSTNRENNPFFGLYCHGASAFVLSNKNNIRQSTFLPKACWIKIHILREGKTNKQIYKRTTNKVSCTNNWHHKNQNKVPQKYLNW